MKLLIMRDARVSPRTTQKLDSLLIMIRYWPSWQIFYKVDASIPQFTSS